MIIYIASDGQARPVSPQHVYQGSSVTDITVVAPFPAQTAMTVAFSLPDGKMFGGVQGTMQTPPYIMTLLPNQSGLPDGVQTWQYVMPFAITQNAGQAKVSITAQFAQGSGEAISFTQQTSAQVEFTIEPSTVGTLPDEPTPDAWSQVTEAIGELDGKILAAQNDISDIENGDTVVGKAKADQKGNVIDETYATQAALAETNEALAVEQENVDDLQNRMTAAEDNITEIRDDASDALEYSKQAFDNSELAVQTANQAKTVADGIDAKATTALETSNEASSNAAQALQKANAATEAANAAQAAVASKQDATDNNLDTTDKTVVGAINENKTAIDGLRQDMLNEAHFRGYFATNAEIQATTANLNDFAYSAQSGTVWIYGESGWADSGNPVPDKTTPLSDATPAQDGTAAAGASTSAARGDHVHPTDTSRAAKSTVDNIISGAQVVGAATKATQDANGNVIDETYATKNELVETAGTEVKVNGATQPEVNFTSDPQTQITANKNAIAEAQSDISDIISGAETVGKATQDANGNVIDTTYATKSGSYENLAVGALLVNDLRDVDNQPSFYYANGQKITSEFKTGTLVGIPDSTYCSLVTIAGWLNDTGGNLTQIAYVGEKMFIRQSVDTSTWGNWAPVFATDPSKLAPSTANGWTQTTATGTLPSAGVYMVAFNYLPSQSQPRYYSPAILVYNGTIGVCTVTDETGILLVSMVVKPSGIQLIDPVNLNPNVQSTNIYYKRIA